ncbi:MAG TPA: tRNA (adenosine(37)-N6)-threonylcarbamoyltransferase complex dimerization subunit type 1 TsaB [Puia sp.]|nr:tRNA (adenosine(37)-N6)-threonylcarbamoyltransferase complex dimerization subunit type 1 TsaB [Puia sp.]
MILLIDTSQETGTTALCKGAEVLFSEENKIAKESASWLHQAIARILSDARITVRDLEAVAVVAGPGSYTGLRVGMAAAKGFCYALKIPMITQNTLRVMAESMISSAIEKQALICPMIDARREEVFTALYRTDPVNGQRSSVNDDLSNVNRQPSTVNDNLPTANRQLSTILQPQALILDKTAFESELAVNPIIFFGTGAEKWKKMTDSSHAIFEPQSNLIQAFARLAQSDFDSKTWADPVYSEPVYLKEFFSY